MRARDPSECMYLVPCELVGRDARAVGHVPDVAVVVVVAREQEPATPGEGHRRDTAQDLTDNKQIGGRHG